MNKYGELLMTALDIVKNTDICRGCVGSCDDCEYSWALTKIEDAIYDYCKLREREIPKAPIDIPSGHIPKPSGHIPKHGNCPNCGCFVVQTCDSARCVVCGQMLKWEEEDD